MEINIRSRSIGFLFFSSFPQLHRRRRRCRLFYFSHSYNINAENHFRPIQMKRRAQLVLRTHLYGNINRGNNMNEWSVCVRTSEIIRPIRTCISVYRASCALQSTKWLEELIGNKGYGDNIFSSNFGFGYVCKSHLHQCRSRPHLALTQKSNEAPHPPSYIFRMKRRQKKRKREKWSAWAVAKRSRCGWVGALCYIIL